MNRKIALIGNPNTGKSSLFNHLTGLRQHVGNYPGITLDKKWGECRLDASEQVEILDLPGVYSVFP
ncbi:MAG: ferrous iron transport protein, partial [Bacteroidota bacterium]